MVIYLQYPKDTGRNLLYLYTFSKVAEYKINSSKIRNFCVPIISNLRKESGK
jgi:hypothetical protein